MSIIPIDEIAIALPFKIDSFGTVGATRDQSKIWQDRVRAVIGTAIGERVYRPTFGCAVANSIYEDEDYIIGTIEQDIKFSFQQFLPLLSLDSVVVTLEEETRIIYAEVTYSTPSSAQFLVKIGVATIDGNNPIKEEISWQTQ